MLVIHTRSTSIFSKEFWKWVARKVLRKYSGPNAVEDSLLRGLRDLNVSYSRNVRPRAGDIVIVLSGVQALRNAISLKKNGVITQLIAGPNVVTYPMDENAVILDKTIDKVVVPSEWVANLWAQEAPELSSKLQVWASGVQIFDESNRSGQPVIYNKLNDFDLLNKVREISSNAVILNYGSFKRADYIKALKAAPYLIYLSKSESQGMALQEAWAHNVPTLVNKSTTWQSNERSWESDQINCPYLTKELGTIFSNTTELAKMIEDSKFVHPKKYCDENLSDKASAQKLLNLLHEKIN